LKRKGLVGHINFGKQKYDIFYCSKGKQFIMAICIERTRLYGKYWFDDVKVLDDLVIIPHAY